MRRPSLLETRQPKRSKLIGPHRDYFPPAAWSKWAGHAAEEEQPGGPSGASYRRPGGRLRVLFPTVWVAPGADPGRGRLLPGARDGGRPPGGGRGVGEAPNPCATHT